MNVIDEIIRDLQREELIDRFERTPFDQTRNSNISKLNHPDPVTSKTPTESTLFTQTVTEPVVEKSEMRYSMSGVTPENTPILPQTRIRLVKRNVRFSRSCKCCDAYVFILDAYCPNCNERMIGNFLYYSYFLLMGGILGFIIFYIATSYSY